ncbi:NERD domain-containing protein/DEAD/DEAH box helicase [Candidatus Pseudothioglobus singularis]|nr:NERD domain-containing protein/DEAD/DEAH box helicase [Candidatus Pseudothioglobus singularis]
MRTIPPQIWHHEIKNNGEKRVMDLLEQINLGTCDVAMHSLNISGGHKQRWSEIDFFVITKRAFIGIEVKAGPVKWVEGYYRVYKDEACKVEVYRKKKSPLVQASDAVETLRKKWFHDQPFFKKIPFVKIAILCSNNRVTNNWPEMQQEYCLYKENLTTPEIFKEYLNASINHFISNDFPFKPALSLSDDQVTEASNLIRPDWDKSFVDQQSVISNLNKEQKSMTEGQYQIIDMFSSLDRILIEGGAGTGKTFLLLYAVKFESTNNKKIAVITKPNRLLNFLKHEVSFDSSIECHDFETLSSIKENSFDVVLIDEGQDWCNNEGIDLIDKVLINGLELGRWRWFGDFENQFDKNSLFDYSYVDYLKTCTGNNALIPLEINVRNTPSIVTALETISKARVGKTTARGDGPQVKRIKIDELNQLIHNYQKINIEDSTILYNKMDNLNSIYSLPQLQRDGCKVEQINEFKGMESNYIFILGLGEAHDSEAFRALYYNSVSRSTGVCYIVDDAQVQKYFLEQIDA